VARFDIPGVPCVPLCANKAAADDIDIGGINAMGAHQVALAIGRQFRDNNRYVWKIRLGPLIGSQ